MILKNMHLFLRYAVILKKYATIINVFRLDSLKN